MIPGEIFTSFAEFQGIVSVNDFRLPIGLQELLQASLGLLWSFCFAWLRLDPLSGEVLHHDCISVIVSRFAIVTEDLVICCYQITKLFSTKYGSAIASSAWGPCNFGPLADLAISVFKEMSFHTVFTQIHRHAGLACVFREAAQWHNSFSLSFDPQEMSLNIDMKMTLAVKFSGVSSNFNSERLTSSLSRNVLNPEKIFHSNSIGSPSILSKFLYFEEDLTIPIFVPIHRSIGWFSKILPRHNTESEKT